MEYPKIDIVTGDDWIGIYIDGKLYSEGHSFDETIFLDILRIPYTWGEASDETYEEYGYRLPNLLSQVDYMEMRGLTYPIQHPLGSP